MPSIEIPPDPLLEPWELAAVIIAGVVLILGCIGYIIKQVRKRYIIPMDLKNPMVINVGIAFYERPKPKDAEIKGTLRDLDGIRVDIDNSIHLFKQKLKYKVYPDYSNQTIDDYKAYWTQNDLIKLLEDKADELEENLKHDPDGSKESESSKYDGLIVEISCHGMDNDIITSDYKRISKTAIHRIFSAKRPAIRDIPRVFIFDCCSGINDRDTDFRSQLEQDEEMEESSSEEEGDDYGKGTNTSETVQGETGKQYDADDVEQDEVLWARDENNPDYKLAVIHAANEGFQSKMSTETGSYVITTLMEKLGDLAEQTGHKQVCLQTGHKEVLQKVLGQIQEDLHQKGKQLLVMTFNNKTENIRFKKNEVHAKDDPDQKESISVEMIEINNSQITQNGDKSMVKTDDVDKGPHVENEAKDDELGGNIL